MIRRVNTRADADDKKETCVRIVLHRYCFNVQHSLSHHEKY